MATIKPFAALRPKPDLASRLCELPYDVMSSEEARQIAAGNPFSFLHVSKPEIDLPAGTDLHSPAVYAKGREHFKRLLAEGALRQDSQASFYLYRQIMGGHHQTGLVAVASCQEYLEGAIKKHELTRQDKEDDRLRHIETLNAQTGPAFLTYHAQPTFDQFVDRKTAASPDIAFTAGDGIQHASWTLATAADIALVEQTFRGIPALYIADGHHRTAAAARLFQDRRGAGHSAWFLSVIFPHHQLQILAYYRVLKDLNGLTPDGLMNQLAEVFVIQPGGPEEPRRKHQIGLFLGGRWHTLEFHPQLLASPEAFERLDVTLLQKHVLAPIFGIDDPRTSNRIDFVGGIRGIAELEKRVNRGDCACAFSMFPTSIEDLMAIADAGGIMPPKSTWFEPKLRDAMFCHLL